MDPFATAERALGMTDATWARHANRWSVYTRFTCLPLIALAIWSRTWIGAWALVPLAAALAWVWLNPRVFPPARRRDTWAARGVAGERLWLDRTNRPVPARHAAAAWGLTAVSASGLPFLVWGLWVYDAMAVLLGLVLAMGAKAWFVDRMVWMAQDMEGRPG